MQECEARIEAFGKTGAGEMTESGLTGRVRVLGLAVVAVLALAGLLASGASAAPEWNGCAKTEPKNTGRYTDKLCATESPTGEGAYELVPSIGKGKGFRGKGGATTLHTRNPVSGVRAAGFPPPVELAEVKCTAVKDKGKLALPNLIKEAVLEFEGCKATGVPCESGSKKGVIVTNSLAGEMVDIEGGSGVGSLLEAEAGPTAPLATFTCQEFVAAWTLLGSVIAEHTGDVGVISKEAQDHFVVGPTLGTVTEEWAGARWEYTPLVNVPTNETGGANAEHFLSSEITEFGHTEPAGTVPSGLEGVADEKSEALMITP
jgi:hypothetical protein